MSALMQQDAGSHGPGKWGRYDVGTEAHLCPMHGPPHQLEGMLCWCEPVQINEYELATGVHCKPIYRHHAPQ